MQLAALAALLLLGACGSGNDSGGRTEGNKALSESERQALQEECDEAFTDFMSSLKEINSRLDIGMNYEEYGNQVSDTKVTYDAIDFEDLSEPCVEKVGVPAEKALNFYVDAYRSWNECIESSYCNDDKNTRELQGDWSDATFQIELAERGLDDL